MIAHRDLAELFAEGATDGKGSRMFIEGDTIYSYGYHFKIAKIFRDNLYLFNTKSYSSSTNRHKCYVKYALPSNQVIEVMDCDINKAGDQIQKNLNEISLLEGKQKRARKESMKDFYKNTMDYLQNQNKLLTKYAVALEV